MRNKRKGAGARNKGSDRKCQHCDGEMSNRKTSGGSEELICALDLSSHCLELSGGTRTVRLDERLAYISILRSVGSVHSSSSSYIHFPRFLYFLFLAFHFFLPADVTH